MDKAPCHVRVAHRGINSILTLYPPRANWVGFKDLSVPLEMSTGLAILYINVLQIIASIIADERIQFN